MQVLIVGHRGTGKSTVGERLAEILGESFVDVDVEIAEHAGEPCAELVSADPTAFRELESRMLRRALDRETSAVITPGAGLESMPLGPLTIWLARDGWEETAETARVRLRPDVSWEEEVAWMRETREPRWAAAAHLYYRIPRGRPAERVARDLAFYVELARGEPNEVARRTWVVPAGPDELDRALTDAERFGFAGVEIRSDVFDDLPEPALPMLASIRTPDQGWMRQATAVAESVDVDLAFLDAFVRSGALDAAPRTLLVSLHASAVDPDELNELVDGARRLQSTHAPWAPHVVLKYAPNVGSFAELGMARALIEPLRRAGVPVTFLPQGPQWAWFRPLASNENATNYVSARLRPSRFGGDASSTTELDAADWLLVSSGPVPRQFDALIGDPVAQSQGDLWHRRDALARNEPRGYLKARVTPHSFDEALDVLADVGVRGVSVTSPLKPRASFIRPHDSSFGRLLSPEDNARARVAGHPVRSGNTLVRTGGEWYATDTDEEGMTACLEWFEEREIGPATVAVFGQGGVSEAILRAIDASNWFLVHHASAREGWTEERPPFVTIVVNAAGPNSSVHENPPRSRGWLDLHYADVEPPPEDVVHLNGDVFFDAQAAAQREFWRALSPDDEEE